MDKHGYKISLSEEEIALLEKIIEEDSYPPKTIMRAKVLLACHEKGNGQGVMLYEIAQSLGISRTTVQNVRADFKEGGFEYVLYNKKGYSSDSKTQRQLDRLMGYVAEMVKEDPPEGTKRWSVRLLCSECEKRGYAEHVAVGKMFRLMKKYNITP